MAYYTSVKTAFQQRNDLIIVALTGRTGSGCSTVASILKSADFQELDFRLPKTIDFNNVDERKDAIIYNYMKSDQHWKRFTVIEASSIIFSFVIQAGIEKFRDYIRNFSEINNKTEMRISAHDELLGSIGRLQYLFNNAELCTFDIKNIDIMLADEGKVDEGKVEEYYKFYVEELPKRKSEFEKVLSQYTCHEEYTSPSGDTKFGRANLYSFFMQHIGNNIRASGDPYDCNYSGDKFYWVAERIDALIKIIRAYDRIHSETNSRICIDALRNPYEAFYFKDKYAEFYLISVNTDEDSRRMRLGHLDRYELANLDNTEFPHKLEHNYEIFFHQNIGSCLEIADIHLYNRQENTGNYYFLTRQIVKYIALMIHPGLVTPSPIERCMQLAYNAKLNSGCLSRQVGAVITNAAYSVKAVGWNDVPSGQVPCNLRDVCTFCENKDEDTYSQFELEDPEFVEAVEAINRKLERKELYGHAYPYCFKDVYNGLKDDRNQVYTRSLHAEENAFLQLPKYGGTGIIGGNLFTTASPCELCAKKAYQLGIKNIFYIDPYPGISFRHILKFGKHKNPNINLFYGAIGSAYVSLYTQRMAVKDELELLTDLNGKSVREYMAPKIEPEFNVRDVRYLLKESEFTFISRETISIKDHDVLQPISKDKKISTIPNRFYWSGSSFDDMTPLAFRRSKVNTKTEELIKFDLQETLDKDARCEFYINNTDSQPFFGKFILNSPLGEDEVFEYIIKTELKDATHIMNPYYATVIQLKTDKLLMTVRVQENIIEDVKRVVYADKNMSPDMEVERVTINPVEKDGYKVYTLSQDHPNLNYTYCLRWRFCQ